MSETKSLASMRKEIYDFLKEEGFDLTEGRQITLSKLIKSYHEKRVVDVAPQKPIEHKITCPECLGVQLKRGKGGKWYIKIMKHAE